MIRTLGDIHRERQTEEEAANMARLQERLRRSQQSEVAKQKHHLATGSTHSLHSYVNEKGLIFTLDEIMESMGDPRRPLLKITPLKGSRPEQIVVSASMPIAKQLMRGEVKPGQKFRIQNSRFRRGATGFLSIHLVKG